MQSATAACTATTKLWMAVEAGDAEIVVTFEYKGAPFPLAPPRLPGPHQPNGRGRYLMEQLAVHVPTCSRTTGRRSSSASGFAVADSCAVR